MSEWMAPKANFYAAIAVICNPQLSVINALSKFNITLSNEGVEFNNTPKPKRERPPKEELLKLYETMDQYHLAQRYNVSQATISTWLKQYREGLSATIDRRIYIDDVEYDRLKEKGLNNSEIAKALGVSKSKITTYKRERGIK